MYNDLGIQTVVVYTELMVPERDPGMVRPERWQAARKVNFRGGTWFDQEIERRLRM